MPATTTNQRAIDLLMNADIANRYSLVRALRARATIAELEQASTNPQGL